MRKPLSLLLAVSLFAVAAAARAQEALPFLSPMFGDNMVLQRGISDPVWGWTTPGARVTVRMGGKVAAGVADPAGKWMAKIGPFPAGGPYEMTVSGPETVSIKNVLVGDVWVCSGQSNMEMGIGNVLNAQEEIASASYPQMRLFTVAKSVEYAPKPTLSGRWDVCAPQTVSAAGWGGFTAVGYFFGRELYRSLNVPIGLIHTSWGGTIAEAWTSAEALMEMPDFRERVEAVQHTEPSAQRRNNPNICTVLYNAMISPVIPYGIKGAIWYQGESNAGRAYQYRRLLPTMIRDWRARWGVGSFPFFIVQLANFQAVKPEPGDDAWAELREAQLMTAQTLPNCGIAVTTDIGDAADIHPKNKQEVGRRLALDALATVYHRKIEYSGPLYRSMKREGSAIRLSFSHLGGGLAAKGDKLEGFAIAGADRKFVWADARIDGGTVVVSSPSVSDPVAVRYAWAVNPVANLFNKAGLPASPFRTDTWPGITANAK